MTCDLCDSEAPGSLCDSCLRYEMRQRAHGKESAPVDQLADAALALARYWASEAARLRGMQ